MKDYIWPKITEDTPIEEIKRVHQQIWDYVIEHGEKPDTPYPSSCVACAYAQMMDGYRCEDCPIIWPNNAGCITDGSGLYDRYLKAYIGKWGIIDKLRLKRIARQIRDLPWKFEREGQSDV